jgi:hypothetical protein
MIPRLQVKLIRKSPGSYSEDGIWEPGLMQESFIRASVQPTAPNDVEHLPEGRREQKSYTLFTNSEVIGLGTSQNSDKFEIFGELFEAVKVEQWANNLINHYMVIVSRVDSPSQGGEE